mmetsp:Transcript_71519/g.167518  ORF Transcript_71519/g.167518 Transcript_71519/m.167518 type:complete len:211 (-) Transcript_71519:324-956(-)
MMATSLALRDLTTVLGSATGRLISAAVRAWAVSLDFVVAVDSESLESESLESPESASSSNELALCLNIGTGCGGSLFLATSPSSSWCSLCFGDDLPYIKDKSQYKDFSTAGSSFMASASSSALTILFCAKLEGSDTSASSVIWGKSTENCGSLIPRTNSCQVISPESSASRKAMTSAAYFLSMLRHSSMPKTSGKLIFPFLSRSSLLKAF